MCVFVVFVCDLNACERLCCVCFILFVFDVAMLMLRVGVCVFVWCLCVWLCVVVFVLCCSCCVLVCVVVVCWFCVCVVLSCFEALFLLG